ncbi:glycosyltransferase family 4 protein [Azospirillum sp.]|uniref:glycosyltransferase family 4 protein n=1 Tax=Azospirillum sp. TaxID=34012 RepID=UPI003D72132B
MTQQLALTWQLTEVHGWGLVGVHTCLYLADIGAPPLLLIKPAMGTLRPENRAKLQGLEAGFAQADALSRQHGGKTLVLQNFNVLHALGNGFVAGPASTQFRGTRNVGVIAYEETRFDDEVLARARSYDKLVVHSAYNRRLLEDRGFTNVGVALQGVDPSEMVALPATKRFGDRFVVFSGGKMEFRKSQDIVLAAFRRFHQRHPDALLITAWHNAWPHTAMSISESSHTKVAPTIGEDGRLRIRDWAVANGVPDDAFVDLGFLGRNQIAGVLAECHAAVFPNRCEGATNLVAMEAMACGVPTILSANTGHMDLLRSDRVAGDLVLTLDQQTPVPDSDGSREGWGESSVDELVERLESLYSDRTAARERAARAQQFILGERTWREFAKAFVNAVA